VVTEIPDTQGTPLTRNDPALTARMLPSLARAIGAENVREVELSTIAEDFSYFAREVPGFFFFVGATPADKDPLAAASNHSPDFFLDERALEVGTRALLQLSVDFLNGGAERR